MTGLLFYISFRYFTRLSYIIKTIQNVDKSEDTDRERD